ncbi:MAG: hypothetical protein M1833_004442 [Piccolia ochrophora]|nr:MAG: hypothetical protein M1833_004442 [Piccolia ochrophora]
MNAPSIAADDHSAYMRLAISYAEQSPPKPTNFRVGAILVDASINTILATGYTLELPGNTHAEQCCLMKYAAAHGIPEEQVGDVLPARTVLYTTMEPCTKRLSGNAPCVDRIVMTHSGRNGAIDTVYVGVKEPDKFVVENTASFTLERHGIQCERVAGFEQLILSIATAGHDGKDGNG